LLLAKLRPELDASAMQPRLRRGHAEIEKPGSITHGVALERHECEQLRVGRSERPQRGLKIRTDPERMALQRCISDTIMFIGPRQPLDELSIPSRPSHRVATQIRRRHQQPRQNRTIYNADAIPAAPKLQERRSDEILSIMSRLSKATRMPKHSIAMQIEQSAKGRTITLQAASPKARLALSGWSDTIAGSRLHIYKCPGEAETVQNISGPTRIAEQTVGPALGKRQRRLGDRDGCAGSRGNRVGYRLVRIRVARSK
jgi:hypothetical protein